MAGNQTLKVFLTSWLETQARPSTRPSTFVAYELNTKKHLIPELGGIRLGDLEPSHIETLLAAKLKSGLSAQTVRHIRTILRRALNFAIKRKLLVFNPAAAVDPPRVERLEEKHMTPEEARAFLAATRGERLEALYHLAIMTGARQGEVLGTRWSDLQLEGDEPTLTISRALQRIGGEFSFVSPKTDRSRRCIALSPSLVKILLAHRKRQAVERLSMGAAWADLDLVFCMEDGSPIERTRLHKDFKRILTKAKVSDFKFHSCRHFAATALLTAGVNPRIVMQQLGHSSIATTLDIYSHVAAASLRDVAAQMAAVLEQVTEKAS